MKSIITEEVIDQIWESGHKRVLELTNLKNIYPTLIRQIDYLRKAYIVCLNSISIRDYNKIEKTRGIINKMETEFEEAKNEYDTTQRRNKKAKEIKDNLVVEIIKEESEEK